MQYGCAVLNPVGRWRHLAVLLAALAVPVLVAIGLMGRGSHPQRFDAKQIVVTPAGDGVHVHEVVDIDFGNERHHGYQRIIPNDFGTPVDVTASSPNAPGAVDVSDEGSQTRIRIGDPNTTIGGRHRYFLDYTLPAAHLSTGTLALDIIGDQETLTTLHFEIVLDGFTLSDPTCNVGAFGTAGGCTLAADGALYRVTFSPLQPGQGVTVGGTIVATGTPTGVAPPVAPSPRHTNRWPLAAVTLVLGLGTAVGSFRLFRRAGRNEVGGANAADAAYADPKAPVRLVTDEQLEALATTEFEPPRGIRPWQGGLLLRETIDQETISAWFSDQIAQQVIELQGKGKEATFVAGAHLAESPPITKQRIDALLGAEGKIELGTYSPRLATLWKQVAAEQKTMAKESGWWKRGAPGSGTGCLLGFLPLVLAAILFGDLRVAVMRDNPVLTVLAAIAVPGLVGYFAYQQLLPARSATGSAMALRAESFRRFLKASEGAHVDWAWKHGLLREYSAWAVALGAADAWGRAVSASAVPPADIAVSTMPLFMYSNASAWHSTFTPPHQSGSGGGGFSGGFSGGGGGGGSSGSW